MSFNKGHDSDEHKAPLLEHLIEFRARLIYSMGFFLFSFAVTYYFADAIYDFLIAPLSEAMQGHPGRRMIFTGLPEAFVVKVKVALYGALFVAFPMVATQIWRFVAPGLYQHERRAFLSLLVATPLLFVLGASLAYYLVMPMTWKFFLGFESASMTRGLPIILEARVSEYLSLVANLVFAFGISFQLPVLLVLLNRARFLSLETLKRSRRYAIVIAFIMAAVLTPPDVMSQIVLGIPLVLLYEMSIVTIQIMNRRSNQDKF